MIRNTLQTIPERRTSGFKFYVLVLTLFFVSTQAWALELPEFDQLVAAQREAVVNIRTTGKAVAGAQGIPDSSRIPEPFRRYFEQLPQPQQAPRASGIGSGFIVSADGNILTNAHVVRGAEEIVVGLNDRREFTATVIGMDEQTDVAMIKIDAQNLPVVTLGNSDELKVGQWVLAIGAPFGFDYTATQGIISALSRSLPNETYVPFIQTDAALNPGNSGGPLFDLEGNVIGINSQIYSRSGGFMGLSFAIPINLARSIADQLLADGHVSRGWLGVNIQNMDQALADSFNLDKPTGALVAAVSPDSPAQAGGLKAGDVIIKYDGAVVESSRELPSLVAVTPAGDNASVVVLRNGKEKTLNVTIGELPGADKKLAQASSKPARLGVTVGNLVAQQREELGTGKRGIYIHEVDPAGPAAQAGLQPNDIVLTFDHQDVADAKGFAGLVEKTPKGSPVAVLIMRDHSTRFLAVTIPEEVG